jgi:carnitine O-palmitoyltransferase 1
LPGLPVPSLSDSVSAYFLSVGSLMDEDAFTQHQLEVQAATAGWSCSFAPLQRHLVVESWLKRNWLTPLWLEYVYLQKRSPIAFFSNYYLLDSSLPPPSDQLTRCCTHLRIFQDLLLNLWSPKGKQEPFLLRSSVPFSVHSYKTCFSTTRVPGQETDVIRVFEKSRHVVVIRHGEFFCFDLVDSNGVAVRVEQLVANVKYILDLAEPSDQERACAVAALTAEERSVWHQNRGKWFSTGLNKSSLAAIESALFVVCLDDGTSDFGASAFAGNGTNRWFDKSFNYIVWKNGRVGLNCEHSALVRRKGQEDFFDVFCDRIVTSQCICWK